MDSNCGRPAVDEARCNLATAASQANEPVKSKELVPGSHLSCTAERAEAST
jgi:hypothetical protein